MLGVLLKPIFELFSVASLEFKRLLHLVPSVFLEGGGNND